MEASAKRLSGTAGPKTTKVAKHHPAKQQTSLARLEAAATKRGVVASEGRPRVKRERPAAPEEMKTSTLHLRLKDGVKEDAAAILSDIGISVPEAIRVFLGRIVSGGKLPFELEVPNAVTRQAMDEADGMAAAGFRSAGELFDDLEKGGRH